MFIPPQQFVVVDVLAHPYTWSRDYDLQKVDLHFLKLNFVIEIELVETTLITHSRRTIQIRNGIG
jgi:hypothetical protein